MLLFKEIKPQACGSVTHWTVAGPCCGGVGKGRRDLGQRSLCAPALPPLTPRRVPDTRPSFSLIRTQFQRTDSSSFHNHSSLEVTNLRVSEMTHLPAWHTLRRYKSYFKNRSPSTLAAWQTALQASRPLCAGCVVVRRWRP